MEHHVRCVTQKFGERAVCACNHCAYSCADLSPSFQAATPVRPLVCVGQMRCGACVGRRALRRRRQQVRRRLACRAGASAHASRRCRAIGLPPSVPADRQLGHRRLPAPMLPHLHRESAGSAALHSVPSWHCPRRAAGAPTRAGRRRARGGRRRALREGWRGYPIYRA
jgi:hypothetical protein